MSLKICVLILWYLQHSLYQLSVHIVARVLCVPMQLKPHDLHVFESSLCVYNIIIVCVWHHHSVWMTCHHCGHEISFCMNDMLWHHHSVYMMSSFCVYDIILCLWHCVYDIIILCVPAVSAHSGQRYWCAGVGGATDGGPEDLHVWPAVPGHHCSQQQVRTTSTLPSQLDSILNFI